MSGSFARPASAARAFFKGFFPALLGLWMAVHSPAGLAATPLSTGAGLSEPVPSPVPSAWPYAEAHFRISTKVPEAQFLFDRGLTLLYAYNPEEARSLFRRVAELDPMLAMAQWGIALSYGMDINTPYDPGSQIYGKEAIERAVLLDLMASPIERALIEATLPRYQYTKIEDADKSAFAYRDAMRIAAKRFPNDPDVLTLSAAAAMDAVSDDELWGRSGKELPGARAALTPLYRALTINHRHIGANHLLIHVLQLSPHPEGALEAANILASYTFEPAAEHLTHMPAHIFTLVGEYHRAGEADRLSIEQFRTYLIGLHAKGHERYFTHDLLSEAYAYMKSGEFARAESAAREFSDDKGEHDTHVLDTIYAYFNRCERVTTISGFAGGYCDAREKNTARARKTIKKLRTSKIPSSIIAADIIEAELAERNGHVRAAISSLTHATRFEDILPPSEPPLWPIPVRELLGGVYYRKGDYRSAERVFREDLAHNRRNPRSLFGLAKTLEREGKLQAAAQTRQAFNAAWAYADSVLDLSKY